MVRWLPYLLSQDAWLIIFGLFLQIGIFVTPMRSVGILHSRPLSNPCNSSFLPRLFVHLTDLHLNSWLSDASNKVDTAFPQIQAFDVDPVVLSGDLVDDREDDFQIGSQQDRDSIRINFCVQKAILAKSLMSGFE
jgi:predicted MPP superfamily phosphohydrolase